MFLLIFLMLENTCFQTKEKIGSLCFGDISLPFVRLRVGRLLLYTALCSCAPEFAFIELDKLSPQSLLTVADLTTRGNCRLPLDVETRVVVLLLFESVFVVSDVLYSPASLSQT